ncbi:MAG TPA: RNA polymerase sigma factor [Verrucomicrobiae bacterium]|jgi:RNA polymerase sigma factor (sigma-70 family)
MITNETIMAVERNSDAELVSRTLAGDRDAFNHIVSRYQILICSLAYSRIGHLGQSEDVAQETFITAWKHLRLLREPEKLRAWLCGILRNRTKKCLHREGREPLHDAEPLEVAEESPATEALPSEQTIGREEEAILWRALEKIPELYREPLILFYREHQSIEHVAVELDLSEDAVKQRLSRGRKLLQEEVQSFVESTLRRTAPGEAFSGSVLAALPLMAGSATASAGMAGKGTAAAKSGLLAAWLLPFIGIFTGFAAQWMMIRGGTARERRTRRVELIITWIFVVGFVVGGQFAVQYLGRHYRWSDSIQFAAMAGFFWFFAMVIATWIVRIFRQTQAQEEQGKKSGEILQPAATTAQSGMSVAMVAGTHLMIFWGIIFMAWQTHDRLGAAIIGGLMAGLGIWNYFKLQGLTGPAIGLAYLRQLASCCIVMLAAFDLRFDIWVASMYGVSVPELHNQMPTWFVPLLTLVLALWAAFLLAITRPKRESNPSHLN